MCRRMSENISLNYIDRINGLFVSHPLVSTLAAQAVAVLLLTGAETAVDSALTYGLHNLKKPKKSTGKILGKNLKHNLTATAMTDLTLMAPAYALLNLYTKHNIQKYIDMLQVFLK